MIAQLILNGVAKRRKDNMIGLLIQTVFQVFRKLYLSINKTTLIKYRLENFIITLPLKHDLILKDDGLSVFNTLKALGYDNTLIYDNTGDFILSLKLEQTKILEELHFYFSGRRGVRYMDMCVFHNNDSHIFDEILLKEIDFAKTNKGLV